VEYRWLCFQMPPEAECQGHEPSAAAHHCNLSEWYGQTAALGLLLSDELTTMILKPCAGNTQWIHKQLSTDLGKINGSPLLILYEKQFWMSWVCIITCMLLHNFFILSIWFFTLCLLQKVLLILDIVCVMLIPLIDVASTSGYTTKSVISPVVSHSHNYLPS